MGYRNVGFGYAGGGSGGGLTVYTTLAALLAAPVPATGYGTCAVVAEEEAIYMYVANANGTGTPGWELVTESSTSTVVVPRTQLITVSGTLTAPVASSPRWYPANGSDKLVKKEDGGGVFTTWTPGVAFNMLAVQDPNEDILYIGSTSPFSRVSISVSQAAVYGAPAYLRAQYWNGAGLTTLTLADTTSALTVAGTLTFALPTDWVQESIDGIYRYWLRIIAGDTGSLPAVVGADVNTSPQINAYTTLTVPADIVELIDAEAWLDTADGGASPGGDVTANLNWVIDGAPFTTALTIPGTTNNSPVASFADPAYATIDEGDYMTVQLVAVGTATAKDLSIRIRYRAYHQS